MMGFAVNGREPGSPEKPSVLQPGAPGTRRIVYLGGGLAMGDEVFSNVIGAENEDRSDRF
jgi:hypothetical protein